MPEKRAPLRIVVGEVPVRRGISQVPPPPEERQRPSLPAPMGAKTTPSDPARTPKLESATVGVSSVSPTNSSPSVVPPPQSSPPPPPVVALAPSNPLSPADVFESIDDSSASHEAISSESSGEVSELASSPTLVNVAVPRGAPVTPEASPDDVLSSGPSTLIEPSMQRRKAHQTTIDNPRSSQVPPPANAGEVSDPSLEIELLGVEDDESEVSGPGVYGPGIVGANSSNLSESLVAPEEGTSSSVVSGGPESVPPAPGPSSVPPSALKSSEDIEFEGDELAPLEGSPTMVSGPRGRSVDGERQTDPDLSANVAPKMVDEPSIIINSGPNSTTTGSADTSSEIADSAEKLSGDVESSEPVLSEQAAPSATSKSPKTAHGSGKTQSPAGSVIIRGMVTLSGAVDEPDDDFPPLAAEVSASDLEAEVDAALLDAEIDDEFDDAVELEFDDAPDAVPRPSMPPPPPAKKPPAVPPAAALASNPAPQSPPAVTPVAPGKLPIKRKPWHETNFDEEYLRTVRVPLPREVSAEVDFIERALGFASSATILDVGCGLGLQAMELARRGHVVVGIDNSKELIGRARREAKDLGLPVEFLEGDMREMAFDIEFDAILSWGTSFGYFDDDTNTELLDRFKSALKPHGRLLLDVANRDYVIASQPNLVWFEGDSCVCMEESKFNYFQSRLQVKRSIIDESAGGKQVERKHSVRLYSPHELGKMLHGASFRVSELSGRLATPAVFFGPDSPRILIVAETKSDQPSRVAPLVDPDATVAHRAITPEDLSDEASGEDVNAKTEEGSAPQKEVSSRDTVNLKPVVIEDDAG